MSAYTDDLEIACSTRNKDVIITSLQPEVDILVDWSAKPRLTINISMCEMAFFNVDDAEVAWQPKITIEENKCLAIPL